MNISVLSVRNGGVFELGITGQDVIRSQVHNQLRSSGFSLQTPSCWIDKSAPVNVTPSIKCRTARSTTGRIDSI